MQTFAESAQRFMPRFATGVAIFLAFWLLGRIVKAVVRRIISRGTLAHSETTKFIAQIVHVCVMVFGTITALGTMGINVSALVAGLGLTGFALGFALKDVLSNILAGFLIVIYRPFRLGDFITVTGVNLSGKVIRLDLRYTTLESDDSRILVPNSLLFTNALILQVKQEAPL